MLFPEPADRRGRPAVHRARPLRRLAEPGARHPGVRRRAAGLDVPRGDRDARRRPDPGGADDRRQPGAVHARRQAARRRVRLPRLHGRRSTSTSTRPPGTPTSSCRPTTALERDQYDLVFHGLAVRNTARFTPAVFEKEPGHAPRVGDLPRPGRPDHRPARPEAAAERSGSSQRARLAVSPTAADHGAADHRPEAVLAQAAQAPRGRRPRPAAPDDARAAADEGQADRPRSAAARRRPRPAAGHARRGPGPVDRRPAADRPPAQAGQQLLDAQHRAAHPRPSRATSC